MKSTLHTVLFSILILFSCNTPKTESAAEASPSPIENYNGPIIDMHLHAYGEGNPMLGMTHPPTLRGKTYQGSSSATEHQEQVMEKFRKYNIVKAVVTNGEAWRENNGDLILVGHSDGTTDDLKNHFENNNLQVMAEMAPFYAGIQANDPSMMPYFELAAELDIPVGFHVLPGGPNNGIHIMPQMLGGMRAKNASPLQLDDALVQYPDLKLYIMHGGWPYTDDVKSLLYMHQNLYVDIAVINWVLPHQEFENYLKELIDAGFGDRILYGTDEMVWPETIDDGIASVNAASFLTKKQKEDIFYNNAARFLGLSDDEIKKHKGL